MENLKYNVFRQYYKITIFKTTQEKNLTRKTIYKIFSKNWTLQPAVDKRNSPLQHLCSTFSYD